MSEHPEEKKKQGKKRKAVIAGRPNRVIYAIANALISLFLKVVFRMKVDKSAIQNLKPPYLVLCNHISNLDFLIAAVAMYPQKLNIMAAALYFQNPLLAWLLTLMGCFPKQQFVSDVQSVRNIIRVTKREGVVLLFPAGQSSFTGQDTLIEPSVARLLQIAQVPVVALKIQGAHIGFPKWDMRRLRRSRVECRAWQLFSAEDLKTMGVAAIYSRVVEALAFDDYEWQRQHRIAARTPRRAERLEQILFLCPGCEREFTIQASGSSLRCDHCGYEANMDAFGLLTPGQSAEKRAFDTPTAWHRWQLDFYSQQLSPDFVYAERVKLHRIHPNGKMVSVGEGEAILTLDAFRVKGTVEGKPVEWIIDNRLSGVFPHEKKTCFEIFIEEQLYAVAPENSRAVFKFILLKEIIYRALHPEAARS